MTFQTLAKIRTFLRGHNLQFKGIYETYELTDGRIVKFIPRYEENTWGRFSETTVMVEA